MSILYNVKFTPVENELRILLQIKIVKGERSSISTNIYHLIREGFIFKRKKHEKN